MSREGLAPSNSLPVTLPQTLDFVIFTLSPVGMQSILISMSVCLSACISQKTTKFHQIFCTCYLWLWLGGSFLCQQCNTVCTSSFSDNIFFIMEQMSHNRTWCVCFIQFARRWHWGLSMSSPTASCWCFSLHDKCWQCNAIIASCW